MTIFILALMFLPSTVNAWNEPDGFLGLKFWKPVSEGTLPSCDDLKAKHKPKPPGESTIEELLGPRDPCWEALGRDGNSHTIKNFALGGFILDVTAESLDRKLAHIFIVFPQGDYGQILLTFKERYGVPTSTKTEIVQSGIGTKFKNEIFKWEGKRLNITVDKTGFGVSKGTIDYETEIWRAHSAK